METERLLLRPPCLGDLDAIHAMRSDPVVVRYLGGRTLNREEAWQRLLRLAGHWSLLGFGMFVVVEKAGGRLIGEVGLFHGCRGLGAAFDDAPEAGWIFASEGQGRGYATEAAVAAHRWFAASHGERRSVCIIDPANAGSFRVAARLGYKSFGEVEYLGGPVTMLERNPG
jgi:RimJ/RimL family protein N-acetyltransferase